MSQAYFDAGRGDSADDRDVARSDEFGSFDADTIAGGSVIVAIDGVSCPVEFRPSGETVRHYLNAAGVRTNPISFYGKTPVIDGASVSLGSLVEAPCRITVNRKVQNG